MKLVSIWPFTNRLCDGVFWRIGIGGCIKVDFSGQWWCFLQKSAEKSVFLYFWRATCAFDVMWMRQVANQACGGLCYLHLF